jgi:hypothetical protein
MPAPASHSSGAGQVPATAAGVAGLVYLIDAGYDFELARPERRPEPGPAYTERLGRLVWVRGGAALPGSAACLGEMCCATDKVRGGERAAAAAMRCGRRHRAHPARPRVRGTAPTASCEGERDPAGTPGMTV